ncbi:hypothetical protein GCM10007907_29500 [Chitinimonas prasina]|uniref:Uncharacterized protein n=1 Tax=Chitinimonas prasina TaxID=1434937 RepID=A0ABQ5YGM8_9NEIS|nr:hypothetical protein [Chitinimonas prasina]GLR14160.1 hypothetical protein GCM10007907_29500 [Chitinimonas prasina]
MLPEDFELTIWRRPHRTWGSVIEIDATMVADGIGGVIQSHEHAICTAHSVHVNLDLPHETFAVTSDQLRRIQALADQISYKLPTTTTGMLGGTQFGLRLSRGSHSLTIEWSPRLEDQTETVKALFIATEQLANSPGSP